MRRTARSFGALLVAVAVSGAAAPAASAQPTAAEPLRVGVVGLVHGHIQGFLERLLARTDMRLVGVAEPDAAVARRVLERRKVDPALLHPKLEAMLEAARPQAVLLFTSTFDHTAAVEACAARGVHVMMEKPLAVSVAHGRRIAEAARRGRIQVLVNYETTWYRSNREVWRIANERRQIGEIRKMVAHDGHRGPREIGVGPEFLAWLTDPKLNGAGALYDFGCYGANLMTWLMDGARPLSVLAVTQTLKPAVYPHVDDEATIVLAYPGAQGIIQASWNWPFDRKDLEVYGATGHAHTVRRDEVRLRLAGKAEEVAAAPTLPASEDDPLAYLAAVVRGEVQPSGLSSLENNLVVTEILDAARRSAATGKAVRLAPGPATAPRRR